MCTSFVRGVAWHGVAVGARGSMDLDGSIDGVGFWKSMQLVGKRVVRGAWLNGVETRWCGKSLQCSVASSPLQRRMCGLCTLKGVRWGSWH
jgi:hypothetical protein